VPRALRLLRLYARTLALLAEERALSIALARPAGKAVLTIHHLSKSRHAARRLSELASARRHGAWFTWSG
jgi:hypothetical protein